MTCPLATLDSSVDPHTLLGDAGYSMVLLGGPALAANAVPALREPEPSVAL